MEYTYGKWEHKSFLNDHIRYLNGTASGILILPLQEKQVRYQDSGIYVCSVSNGVPDEYGKYFQKEQSYVISKGPPVFVKDNKQIQYGDIGKPMDLMVYVQSWLNITNHSVATTVREIQHLKVAIYHIKIKDTFHGQLIHLFGWTIVFRFPESTIDQFQNYTITISNELGSADYVTELKSQGKYEIVEKSLSVQSVVILSLVVIIVILVAGIVLYVRRLKQRYRERMEPAINVQTPERTFGESSHYTEIIEDDNLQPTSQENDNSIMSMINRDIDIVSAEHTSTSSDNDRDSSECLEDGYEQPYTTLLVTDQVKDDHVYLTTKKESNYENAIPFQNVACGHACEFLEEDSLSDKTNAHDDQENWNLKYEVNDFNETNDSVPHTYIYPQMNKAVYINLSLNQ
ncbi:uncharacterized protein LOC127738697 isoform X2 [Mytilus californianus]|uniref:uncharacterized protein LOC127738697 isoform X2 n=1 Tax=Mytilus californianus TaxID=6549 RepID=UPI002246B222|nr:uncharacterized protein LOC127738697 isoform X2 [Mytilus californianus]